MITIKESFNWSPNGYDIETIEAGDHDELPDRAVAIAGELDLLADVEAEKKQLPKNKKAPARKTPGQNK